MLEKYERMTTTYLSHSISLFGYFIEVTIVPSNHLLETKGHFAKFLESYPCHRIYRRRL